MSSSHWLFQVRTNEGRHAGTRSVRLPPQRNRFRTVSGTAAPVRATSSPTHPSPSAVSCQHPFCSDPVGAGWLLNYGVGQCHSPPRRDAGSGAPHHAPTPWLL